MGSTPVPMVSPRWPSSWVPPGSPPGYHQQIRFGLQGVAIALLPFSGRSVPGAAVSLVLFGLGFGVASTATPAILLDRYGDQGYATIAGILGTPTTISRAAAPLGAAALAMTVGYLPLILGSAAACVVSGAALALTRRLPAAQDSRVGQTTGEAALRR